MPGDVEFATKPALAAVMITRAVDAGAPARWVAGDEVYGNDPKLRAGSPATGSGSSWRWPKTTGSSPPPGPGGRSTWPSGCRRGPGSGSPPATARKAARFYDWALIETTDPALPEDGQGANWLLIRRHPGQPRRKGRIRVYRAHAPAPVPLHALVQVAGTRWKVEEAFAGGKELTAWTSTRSGPGRPGPAGPSWRCSPTHSCPS